MSVQTYNYDFKFPWSITIRFWPDKAQQQVEDDLKQGMSQVAAQKFAEAMAQSPHWFRVNNTNTTLDPYDWNSKILFGGLGGAVWQLSLSGTTVLNFDCDVADPQAHNSPQLTAIIASILLSVAAAILAHPAIFLIIVLVVAFAISSGYVINTGTGAIIEIGKHIGSIVTLGIVVVSGLAALYFLPQIISAVKQAFHKKTRRRRT